ncbi:MAG TPA: RHS repeat-associated core domain-containing protein, partial [Thermoanaerobaculia bacterium]|nr:RHS repeat-associated core domain-containing protein [Thermoanaerobaculia bacterium]
RVRLSSGLTDNLGRRFGRTESLEWRVPEAPATGPIPAVIFDKKIATRFESWEAAKDDLSGRFPGGQTSLFQGLWTDPVTGVAYARARWYDSRNASWLSEDPLLDVDSSNLYAFVGHQPNMGTDPLGLQGREDCGFMLSAEAAAICNEAAKAQAEYAAAAVKRSLSFGYHELEGANQRLLNLPNDLAQLPQATFGLLLGFSEAGLWGMDCISFPKQCAGQIGDFFSDLPGDLSEALDQWVDTPADVHARAWGEAEFDALLLFGPGAAEFGAGKFGIVNPRPAPASLRPAEINFSQRTVNQNVRQYTADMAAGEWNWSRSGPIRVMERDGQWVTYDNRRLMAAQNAQLPEIPVQVVQPGDLVPGTTRTWEEAFQARFSDSRNVDAGAVVPNKGLSAQPAIAEPKPPANAQPRRRGAGQ